MPRREGAGRKPRQSDLERWREFANQYIIDFDGTAAIERCAGYTATRQTAAVTASRLLANVSVQGFIREALESRRTRLELSQDNVVREQLRIAMADIRNYMRWDNSGTELIPSDELTEDAARAIEVVEYWEDELNTGESSYVTKRKLKFKLHSKSSALDALGRHLGLYDKDNVRTIKDDRQSQIDSVMDILKQTRDRITPEADEDGDAE